MADAVVTVDTRLKNLSERFGWVSGLFTLAAIVVDLLAPDLQQGVNKWLCAFLVALVVAVVWRVHDLRKSSPEHQSDVKLLLGDRAFKWVLAGVVFCTLLLVARSLHADSKESLVAKVPGASVVQEMMLARLGSIDNQLTDINRNTEQTNSKLGEISQSAAQTNSKLDDVSQNTSQTNATLNVIVEKLTPQTARAKLKELGYGLDGESKARVIEAADLEALALYEQAGETMSLDSGQSFGGRIGSRLELPIVEKSRRAPELIAMLGRMGVNLNQPHQMTYFSSMTRPIPHFDALRKRIKTKHPIPIQPHDIYANALAIALWVSNEEAVRALVKAGADVNQGVSWHGVTDDLQLKLMPFASSRDVAAMMGHQAWLAGN